MKPNVNIKWLICVLAVISLAHFYLSLAIEHKALFWWCNAFEIWWEEIKTMVGRYVF